MHKPKKLCNKPFKVLYETVSRLVLLKSRLVFQSVVVLPVDGISREKNKFLELVSF